MILQNKLDKPYENYTIREKVWLQCDYCEKIFQRVKKSIGRLNKTIKKDSCGGKDCTQKKKEEINVIKYGSPNLFTSELFKQKQQETNIAKYGVKEYFDSEDFHKKRKEKLLEKYGVESPLQNEEIKNKQQNTCFEKYGVHNYSLTEECENKKIATSMKNYGCEHPMQNPEVTAKRDETCNEKFGAKSYVQTKEYWEKRKKTCIEKYGVEHPHQLKEIRAKAIKTNLERYAVANYAQTEEFRERFIKICNEKYGVPNPLCLQTNQIYGKSQNDLKDFLNNFGFNFQSDYTILKDKEIDLYDENLKIGIEYCGLFWHTELSPTPRLRLYHYDKYLKCLEKGVRLITIFEDEWKHKPNQCKSILLSNLGKYNQKIYARNCQITNLNKIVFNQLCNQYHLQGSNNLGIVFYGLEFENEIVAAMSLGRHHRNKNIITLDRLFFKSNVQILGGASKLFKQCEKWAIEHNYKQIITWSDNRWSQGDIYEKLGFTLNENLPPDYSYVDIKKPYKRISKQSQKKSNTGCKDMTEKQWSLENGLARIWDCGKKRWIKYI